MDKKQKIKNRWYQKNDNKCFQYAEKLALDHKQTGKDSGRITKIKPFIENFNWEEINFSSGIDDWKKSEKNNLLIALNILYAYISKDNSKREKTSYSFNNSQQKKMALYCTKNFQRY